jgi:hypothetical protein
MESCVSPGSRAIDNNEDLYEFLLRLAEELQAHGEAQLAKEVIFASRFASGSASEFLHEAHHVLTKIEQCRPALTPKESRNLKDVITQIDQAFRTIGGA